MRARSIAASVGLGALLSCASPADSTSSAPSAATADAVLVRTSAPGPGAPGPVRFVALGDTGLRGPERHAVAAAMVRKCAESGCDFAVLLGDNFYPSGVTSLDDPRWQTDFEDVYRDLDIPFYAVLGNHDYGTDGAGLDEARAQVQVDYSRVSSRWRMPARHYRFAHGNAEFFVLDTQEQLLLQADQQQRRVAQWLAASTATWKIALGHHPLVSNGPHGIAGAYNGLPFLPFVSGGGVKDFLEDTVCGKVDLYLCGHDHSRQYLTETCRGTELAVSGAGSRASHLDQKNPYRFQAITAGFLYVRIEGNRLTSEFVDDSGQVEFTRVLTR